MGKFDGVLICSDIDGTLLSRGVLPEENQRAIKYFQDNGGRFTLCTGRNYDFFDKFAHLVRPNAPFIAMNGTIINDRETGDILYSCPLSADPGKIVTDALRELPYLTSAYVYQMNKTIVVKPDGNGMLDVTMDEETLRASNAAELNEILGYPEKSKIYKIVFIVPDDKSDEAKSELINRYPDFSVFRSWKNGIELQSAEIDKGKGARLLSNILGDVSLLVCAGDYENDIAMIEAADIGYAVANALPSVKAAADRVTKRECAEGAIAEIIHDLDNKPED